MNNDIYEKLAELEEASYLSNDELGEWWQALVGLNPRVYDSASEEFRAAFEKEVRSEHKRLKTDFRIEEESTQTQERVYRTLVHKSEW